MSHKMLIPFIVKWSVLGYVPLVSIIEHIRNSIGLSPIGDDGHTD